jgi:hypothetical protein
MIGNPFKTKDTTLNFIYSAGAAVVILGALFKLNHWNIGPLTGTWIQKALELYRMDNGRFPVEVPNPGNSTW